MAVYGENAVNYPFKLLTITQLRDDNIFIQGCFAPFAPPLLPFVFPHKKTQKFCPSPFTKKLL